ncbi:hypothetical protein BJP34_32645 [Moorena producens PAL-8-15-08-1]|uniref:Cysteine dioxygenase n=1 Tax=Moorena producens PAL-8-15-08-1 TaxID=1458985 RepID=A0A1D8U0Y2_9CYAN|nr:cysteine dioxygenase family protein [Moorena producens]AOX03552.1 hypothetical protein BJP34_32645 [Moorena producens PAL-8-15-08-1]
MFSQCEILEDSKEQLKTIVREVSEPDNLPEHSELFQLVQEYHHLATQKELTQEDGERMAQMFELAVLDSQFDQCIDRVDQLISQSLQSCASSGCSGSLSLDEFIYQVNAIAPQDMSMEKFKELAANLNLSEKLLEQSISFNKSDYHRQLVCMTRFGDIFVISWEPGQFSQIHTHGEQISIIRVYKGTLTHRFYDPVEHLQGKQGYRKNDEKKFTEGELTCVGFHQTHQLANESQKRLVTVHVRFFK